jgi:hypothetical protein
MKVVRIREERGEIRQPHELRALAERVLQLERVPAGLDCRPEEKDERDRDLRRDQRVGQPGRAENDAFFHPAAVALTCWRIRSGAGSRSRA